MPETQKQQGAVSHPARLPLILTALLLLCSLAVAWHICNQYNELRAQTALLKAESIRLQEHAARLQSLLNLAPCEAAAKMLQEKPVRP